MLFFNKTKEARDLELANPNINFTPVIGFNPVTQGYKLFACIKSDLTLMPNETITISTGINVELIDSDGKVNMAFTLVKVALDNRQKLDAGVIYTGQRTGTIELNITNDTEMVVTITPGKVIGELFVISEYKPTLLMVDMCMDI